MSRARRSSKAAGDAIEAEVIQHVPELAYVGEETARWHDARTEGVLAASETLTFDNVLALADGTPVEIKAAQRRLNSGQRGRYYIRRRQHDRLVDEGAAYLFAVYDPRSEDVLAMHVSPAAAVDELLPDGWTDVDDEDRREQGYRQLAWSNLFDPDTVEGSP